MQAVRNNVRNIHRVAKCYYLDGGRNQTTTALMAAIAPPSGLYRRVMIVITIMQRKAYSYTFTMI